MSACPTAQTISSHLSSAWSIVQANCGAVPIPLRVRRSSAEPFALWALDLKDLPADVLSRWGHALISAGERQQMEAHRLDRHRRLYLATRMLVRLVLSQYADRAPADWLFARNSSGRPTLPPDLGTTLCKQHGYATLQFNLSRSGSVVVCAVSTTGLIGVDVEDTTRDFLPSEIADGVLTQDEMRHFMAVPPSQQKALLLRYWVLKEAFVKALGTGFAVEPRSIGFEGVTSDHIVVRTADHAADLLPQWSFRHGILFDRYSCAIAYRPLL